MSIDPKRIVEEDGASPLAAMLCAAREDGLTPEEVDRVRAGVTATAIVAGGATAAATAKPAGLFASLSAKVGIALAVAGVASGGAWLALRDRTPLAASPPAQSVETVAAAPSREGPASASIPPSEPPVDPASPAPVASAAPRPWRPKPPPLTAPSAPATPSSATPIPADEGALLLEARRALENDPAHALELVREHEKQFPNSQLGPERARIEAQATKRVPR